MKLKDYGYHYPGEQKETDYNINDISLFQNNIITNREISTFREEMFMNDWDYNTESIIVKKISNGANKLFKHLKEKSHIAIVSDSDCDGLTSAATTYRILKYVFNHPEDQISVIINKRKHGNSFNKTLVNRVKELHKHKKIDLMYSCDQGSLNGIEYRDFAETCGFEMIITDHHQVREGELYPFAKGLVFVNPNDIDNPTGYNETKGLSGCTITLFLLMITYGYLKGESRNEIDYRVFYPYFDLVALSVVSDIMPCDNRMNRWLYKIGVNVMNRSDNVLFNSLRFVLDIPGKIELSDIRMKIAPFVNSANRMDVEDIAYTMLSSNVEETIIQEAERLVLYNKEKKDIIKTITKELIQGLDSIDCSDGIIVTIKDVAAVNGIIAGKIGSLKRVPTICFIDKGETLAGSCRAIVPGFDLIELFTRISKQDSNVILNFGGHKDACGVHIDKDFLDVFQGLFFQNVHDMLEDIPKDQLINIDYMVKEEDLDLGLIYSQNSLAPYGKEFKDPILLSIFYIKAVIPMGDIMKVIFRRKNGGTLSGFYNFGTSDYITIDNAKNILQTDVKCLVSYSCDVGSYAGSYDINLNILKIDII